MEGIVSESVLKIVENMFLHLMALMIGDSKLSKALWKGESNL
jgi:hypothetical protein